MTYGIFLLLLLVSCSRELDNKKASTAIESHLRSVAPREISARAITFELIQILYPDENNRDVRVNAKEKPITLKTGEKFGGEPKPLSFLFQRGSNGWTLTRYGDTTIDFVAELWSGEVLRDYDLLTRALDKLSSGKNVTPNTTQSQLARLISEKNIDIPNSIEWGIRAPDFPNQPAVLWVRERADKNVMCAKTLDVAIRLRNALFLPLDFIWMTDEFLSCSGRKHDFGLMKSREKGKELIKKNGGLLPPY